ncbi:MAG: hypothetical protein R2911_05800 [Caldilineaceae bacterium]
MISIIVAGLTISVSSIAPALGEGAGVGAGAQFDCAPAGWPSTITHTLFVGLAMVESTAIYCFVVAMILIFR